MTSDGVFHALARPTRREALRALRVNASLLAGEPAEKLSIPGPTRSGHLGMLRNAVLIVGERRGAGIRHRANTSVAEGALMSFLNRGTDDEGGRS